MRPAFIFSAVAVIMIITATSCKERRKEHKAAPTPTSFDTTSAGLIIIGYDIITEVILKPESSGDPWELEKVKGFNGEPMFLNLLEKIKQDKIKVYDCITGEILTPSEAKKILRETDSDISKIGKIQFIEDWYFNPATNEIIKKVKSMSFGYELEREEGLPPAYKPWFRIKTE
ncbi:MAG TPA: hypothetical protein PLN06_07055 [Bacteroidales bacterium]|nr:hypothetical protein [Bacteroidales bacterium]HOU96366.1 hypothetical protein [Bacteroidales bacterium]HQG36698.1 hypothetical protein [Bacteroidales bacterium]HQG52720.1 hypothetical protein [Bacteroidales bacterium]